jgi:nitroreductase
MGGFEKDKISVIFSLPENIEPIVLIAVGKIKEPVDLSEDFQKRENAPRSRKPLSELILKGLK